MSTERLYPYLPEDLYQDARAAFYAAPRSVGSWSEYVASAALAYVEQKERDENDGRPFSPAEPGELRRKPKHGANPTAAKKGVQIYVSPGSAARIRGTAKGLDITLSDLFVDAVKEHIKDQPRTDPPARLPEGRPLDRE